MLNLSTEAISVTREHLETKRAYGTEIEAYLVRYLLVVICAEIEARVLAMVVERAQRTNDPQVASFVENVSAKAFRRVRTGEMAGLLNHFDPALKDSFKSKVDNTSAQVAFDKIVNNRHNMAHGRATVNMTFTELCTDFTECRFIINAFAVELGLPAD